MKKIVVILILIISAVSYSQTDLKSLKDEGSSLKNIIPNNWKILESKKGDLNDDGIPDLVFAIQNTDTSNIKLNKAGVGSDTLDLNPRTLGIYFGKKNGTYKKTLISKQFIILKDSPTLEEPFSGLEIDKNGTLEIDFRIFYNAGSWNMSNHRYKFKYQNKQFVLIDYQSNETNRASGKTSEYSINFLTQKIKISKGNISKDFPESVNWKKFKLNKNMTLMNIGKPLETELEGIQL
jgi:hypothetical protein